MSADGESAPGDGAPGSGEGGGAIVREVAAMAGAAFVLVLAATVASQFVPLVSRYLSLIVAVVFLGLPYWWLERNDWSFERFGLVARNLWRDAGIGLGLAVLTAVPFAGGYWVWETYALGATYEFEWENYLKWEPELKGEPPGWGEEPGVWTWTEEWRLHVGVVRKRGGGAPPIVRLSADRRFRPRVRGAARMEPVAGRESDGAGTAATAWRLTIVEPGRRGEVVVAPTGPGGSELPRRLEVSIRSGASSHPLHSGAEARRADGDSRTFERGLRWLFLWAMTQLLFIALPEEYFYRGYVQTRVRDAIEQFRASESDDVDGESRSWWGISEENLVASLLFGVGHLLTPVGGRILWNRIGVVFPSVIFGWLRDRTDSIAAPVVYHAGCNMLVLIAEPHFF